MAARKINLHLGTMTFGWSQASTPVTDEVAGGFLKAFLDRGHTYLDCARIYAGGDSEEMVGRVMAQADARGKVQLVTKAHPSQENGISPEGIRAQLAASLRALSAEKIDVLYLHQPDTEHPLAETLACVKGLLDEGVVGAFGLSNYSVPETERVLAICRENAYPLPTCYQGLYNGINRRVEGALLPLLRANGVAFVAYNPLAAGLLTGKHRKGAEVAEGRFKNNPNYLDRFYKVRAPPSCCRSQRRCFLCLLRGPLTPFLRHRCSSPSPRVLALRMIHSSMRRPPAQDDCLEGVEGILAACEKNDIKMVHAAYAWLLSHSALGDGDGVLLGASSLAQLEDNLGACAAGTAPLPDEVVAAFDAAWALCEPEAFAFWRGYSSDHPGREDLDPGAAYVVKK
jgi:aflatoxin B1 aldehyde reductase